MYTSVSIESVQAYILYAHDLFYHIFEALLIKIGSWNFLLILGLECRWYFNKKLYQRWFFGRWWDFFYNNNCTIVFMERSKIRRVAWSPLDHVTPRYKRSRLKVDGRRKYTDLADVLEDASLSADVEDFL